MAQRGTPGTSPDAVRQLVGTPVPEIVSSPVEAGQIRRYCEVTENANPLYADDEVAREAGYPGVIAPPVFYQVPLFQMPGAFAPAQAGQDISEVAWLMGEVGMGRALDVQQRMEFHAPVRPGDVLRRRGEIAEIVPKETAVGAGSFCTLRLVVENQRGETVCVERQTYFLY